MRWTLTIEQLRRIKNTLVQFVRTVSGYKVMDHKCNEDFR